mmetsp:Transcript_18909/g.72100  ORF Transcript_18909/g.72100 Transcript_18909/m.72100 type:complete len:323 (+) Transcript_18909:2347-3315(+)
MGSAAPSAGAFPERHSAPSPMALPIRLCRSCSAAARTPNGSEQPRDRIGLPALSGHTGWPYGRWQPHGFMRGRASGRASRWPADAEAAVGAKLSALPIDGRDARPPESLSGSRPERSGSLLRRACRRCAPPPRRPRRPRPRRRGRRRRSCDGRDRRRRRRRRPRRPRSQRSRPSPGRHRRRRHHRRGRRAGVRALPLGALAHPRQPPSRPGRGARTPTCRQRLPPAPNPKGRQLRFAGYAQPQQARPAQHPPARSGPGAKRPPRGAPRQTWPGRRLPKPSRAQRRPPGSCARRWTGSARWGRWEPTPRAPLPGPGELPPAMR